MVKETTNYKRFKHIEGNRGINMVHVRGLMESITVENLLPHIPILVNNKMEIIDGQHRFEAAKRLGIPVPYVVVSKKSGELIKLLNTNIRKWLMSDYLTWYCTQGKEAYEKFRQFMEDYGFSVSISLLLLGGGSRGTRYHGTLLRDFKNGDLDVSHLEEARATANNLSEMRPFTERGTWKERKFIKAVRVACKHKAITHAGLLGKLEACRARIKGDRTIAGYLRQLEAVVNHQRVEGKPIRLF